MSHLITFYSYKGGVGRTMCLANVASLLASQGGRVLVIDWDLEAPGLQKYFDPFDIQPPAQPSGMLALLESLAGADEQWIASSVNYESVITLPKTEYFTGATLSAIFSGADSPDYQRRVLSLDWRSIFGNANGASHLERLRESWQVRYDFVLIDSRTGITDAGGICTIFFPDTLAIVFAPNSQSSDGAREIALQAIAKRNQLAVDRQKLAVLPIPSRFDSRTEAEETENWMKRVQNDFDCFLSDWCPGSLSPLRVFERTKLPHVPFFSFGEKLAVVSHPATDPDLLPFYYQSIATLLSHQFREQDVFDACGMKLHRKVSAEVLSEHIRALSATSHESVRSALQSLYSLLDLAGEKVSINRWGPVDPVPLVLAAMRHSENLLASSSPDDWADASVVLGEIVEYLAFDTDRSTSDLRPNLIDALNLLGQARAQLKQYDQAENAIKRAIQLAREIAESQPDLIESTQRLSTCILGLGELLLRRSGKSDQGRALAALEESLEILRARLAESQASADVARHLSDALSKVGNLYSQLPESEVWPRAVNYYFEALQIRRRIWDQNPTTQAARDLTAMLNQVGDFLLRRDNAGDAKSALEYFRESLKIARQVREINPTSVQALQDASTAEEKMALADERIARQNFVDLKQAVTTSHDVLPSGRGELTMFLACSFAQEKLNDAGAPDPNGVSDWELGQIVRQVIEQESRGRIRIHVTRDPHVHYIPSAVRRDIYDADIMICLFTKRTKDHLTGLWLPSTYVISEGAAFFAQFSTENESAKRLYGFVEDGVDRTQMGMAFSHNKTLPSFRRTVMESLIRAVRNVVEQVLNQEIRIRKEREGLSLEKSITICRDRRVRVETRYRFRFTTATKVARFPHSIWSQHKPLPELSSMLGSADARRCFLRCVLLSCGQASPDTCLIQIIPRESSPSGHLRNFDVEVSRAEFEPGDELVYALLWENPDAFFTLDQALDFRPNSVGLESASETYDSASLTLLFERDFDRGDFGALEEPPQLFLAPYSTFPAAMDPVEFWHGPRVWRAMHELALNRNLSGASYEVYSWSCRDFHGMAKVVFTPHVNYFLAPGLFESAVTK